MPSRTPVLRRAKPSSSVLRPVPTADLTTKAGMIKAPARGIPRRLGDFDPASLLTRPRRGTR